MVKRSLTPFLVEWNAISPVENLFYEVLLPLVVRFALLVVSCHLKFLELLLLGLC